MSWLRLVDGSSDDENKEKPIVHFRDVASTGTQDTPTRNPRVVFPDNADNKPEHPESRVIFRKVRKPTDMPMFFFNDDDDEDDTFETRGLLTTIGPVVEPKDDEQKKSVEKPRLVQPVAIVAKEERPRRRRRRRRLVYFIMKICVCLVIIACIVFVVLMFRLVHAKYPPTPHVTKAPTLAPSSNETLSPTEIPTATPPTSQPPTLKPSLLPTSKPSPPPTLKPTLLPTLKPSPPTLKPSPPTLKPSPPTLKPTPIFSESPTVNPTNQPSNKPTNAPSKKPTSTPSVAPTPEPTNTPRLDVCCLIECCAEEVGETKCNALGGEFFSSVLDGCSMGFCTNLCSGPIITTYSGDGSATYTFTDGTPVHSSGYPTNSTQSLCVGTDENLYVVVDGTQNQILRLDIATGRAYIFAGFGLGLGTPVPNVPTMGITARDIRLGNPIDVIEDRWGNIYFTDNNNFGQGKVIVVNATSGLTYLHRNIASASMLAFDSRDNLYVSQFVQLGVAAVIFKIDAVTGIVSVFAGQIGSQGFSGDGGLATSAVFSNVIRGLAIDPETDDMYIADSTTHVIRVIRNDTGIITTIAGTPLVAGYLDGPLGVSNTKFSTPYGLAFSRLEFTSQKFLYIADRDNNVIRRIDLDTAQVITVAGIQGAGAYTGDGGAPLLAKMFEPRGVAVLSTGPANHAVFVTDRRNKVVRKFSYCDETGMLTSSVPTRAPTPNPTTVAPSIKPTAFPTTLKPTPSTTANPTPLPTLGPAVDICCLIGCCMEDVLQATCETAGGIFVTLVLGGCQTLAENRVNPCASMCTLPKIVTYAGTGTATPMLLPPDGAPGLLAPFADENFVGGTPGAASGIYCNPNGNLLYLTGFTLRRVYLGIVDNGYFVELAGGGINPVPLVPTVDIGPADVFFLGLGGMANDQLGVHLFIVQQAMGLQEAQGNVVVINGTTGLIHRYGNSNITLPTDIAFDAAGNAYVGTMKNIIVKIDTSQIVTLFAGQVGSVTFVDNAFAAAARFGENILGLVVDLPQNHLYVVDNLYHVIRRIRLNDTFVDTIAGKPGVQGFLNGPIGVNNTRLSFPRGITIAAPTRTLYVGDFFNNQIRKIDLVGGTVTTAAGSALLLPGYTGDGFHPLNARMDGPDSVFADKIGNVYFRDTGNHVIRKFNYCNTTIAAPTVSPTKAPTDSPTDSPTHKPTTSPTDSPTHLPTDSPTEGPTSSPTLSPTDSPTYVPTLSPAPGPTMSPTEGPSETPTHSPTFGPSASPTLKPTKLPTANPTHSPTASPTPTPLGACCAGTVCIGPVTQMICVMIPGGVYAGDYTNCTAINCTTANPTHTPTGTPTFSPTTKPTPNPTPIPSGACCIEDLCTENIFPFDCGTFGGIYAGDNSVCVTANCSAIVPTRIPTVPPTNVPTTTSPTNTPSTAIPTNVPTANPTTKTPTNTPTANPTTKAPTLNPTTKAPTLNPTTKSPTPNPTNKPTFLPTSSPTVPLTCDLDTFTSSTRFSDPDPQNDDGFGWSVAVNQNYVVAGSYSDGATGFSDSGSAFVYNCTTSTCVLMQNLTHPDPQNFDQFGYAVAIDALRVVVGCNGDNVQSGSAFLYDCTSLPCSLVHNFTHPAAAGSDYYGSAVAIDGNYVVIGAPEDNAAFSKEGSAFLYDCSNLPCLLVHNFTDPNPEFDGQFGFALAISGTRVAIGAPNSDSIRFEAGVVYLFDCSILPCSFPEIISHPNSFPTTVTANAHFGHAVGISGDLVIVGAAYDNVVFTDAGSAFLFNCSMETCGTSVHNFTEPAPATNNQFGFSVAISGSNVLIGTPNANLVALNAGAAYLYDCTTLPCVLKGTFTDGLGNIGDNLGWSVGIDCTTSIVGAPWGDAGVGTNQGISKVYHCGDVLSPTQNPTPSP